MKAGKDQRPLPRLLLNLPDALARLVQQEMALARAELGERMTQLALGIGMVVGSSIILFVALLIVLMGLSELLGEFLPEGLALWLGYLIVGGLALGAGIWLLLRGISNLRHAGRLAERTVGSIEEDFTAIRSHMRSGPDPAA